MTEILTVYHLNEWMIIFDTKNILAKFKYSEMYVKRWLNMLGYRELYDEIYSEQLVTFQSIQCIKLHGVVLVYRVTVVKISGIMSLEHRIFRQK